LARVTIEELRRFAVVASLCTARCHSTPAAAEPSASIATSAKTCDTQGPFPFGRFALSAGWCWERTEEGDDQGGALRDDRGRIRMRYSELSHGEPVGDACAPSRKDIRGVRSEKSGGIPFRACDIGDREGHQCFSFGGAANLCTVGPPLDGFSASDFVRTLRR
jgi:hypothetical protein